MLSAVLFDFSDTLFWRNGGERSRVLLADSGVDADVSVLAQTWNDVKAASGTAQELAKRRDCSAEAHRRCWVELLQPFNAYHPSAALMMYGDQPNPVGWEPFPETVEVLHAVARARLPIGVVSDIGWDLRPIFEHHGVAHFVDTWVLSYEHGTEKPDPRMFELGCAGLGSLPHQTLMVGDSVEKDAGAAKAGLTALTLPAYSGSGERGLRRALRLLDL